MKKHFIAVLSMMMCFVLSVGIFTACDTETDVPKKYTISFYDGDELVDDRNLRQRRNIDARSAQERRIYVQGLVFG